MKKVLCILTLLCAVCTGAWAEEIRPTYVSSNTTKSANDGEHASKLVDATGQTTKWGESFTNGSTELWIIVRADNTILKSYTLTNGNDTNTYPGRRWASWTVEGSNSADANGTWTTIDTQTDATVNYDVQYASTTFSTSSNTTGYNYYKITLTKINGTGQHADMHQMCDLKFDVEYVEPEAFQDGATISLQNKQHGFYLGVYNNQCLTGTTSKDINNVWRLDAVTGGYKLYNVSCHYYASPIESRNDRIAVTNDVNAAGIYDIEAVGSYYALNCKNGANTGYTYFHGVNWTSQVSDNPKLCVVDWNKDADASEWIIDLESAVTQDEINALQAKINEVYGKIYAKTIGYPYYNTGEDTPQANIDAVNSIANYVTNEAINADNYAAALNSLNAVYALTDINLPIPGKAYYIKNVHPNGTVYAFKQDGENDLQLVNTSNTELDESSVYVYYRSSNSDTGFQDGFVNAKTGKYLIWKGHNNGFGLNDNKGYIDEYDNRACGLRISKPAGAATEDKFGLVTFGGKRRSDKADPSFIITSGGEFNAYSLDYVYYDSNFSTLFRFEEVVNPNKVKLTCPTTEVTDNHGLNGKYVGTFSAPYNVKLSSEVIAYTAEVEGNKVTFKELGHVVPKNIGVLLYAPVAAVAITKDAEPAIENVPDMSDRTNALVGTNGAKLTVDESVNAYILSKDEKEGVKFYPLADSDRTIARNKAYLVLTASGVTAFRFDFEEEQTTGVEAIEAQQGVKKAYDIAGRSVDARKHGLYIIGGNKVIR